MTKVKHLKGFSEFTGSNPIFEMASELSKIGVPKDLMQFIHNLTGEKTERTLTGWMRGGKFRTLAGEYGGDWPSYQDDPLSHDVQVIGTKTGKERVYNYLTSLPTDRDIPLRLILVNPEEEMVHYITRKTGKTKDWKGYDPDRPEVSQKRGFYMRIITIDRETGEPVAAWRGTISQLLEDVTDESILYIMEQEERVKSKREVRKSYEMSEDKFIEYFEDKYINIVNKALEKKTGRRREEFKEMLQDISPEDVAKLDRYNIYKSDLPESLINVIKKATEISTGAVDKGLLKVELKKFLEYLANQGKYETDPNRSYDKVALLDDVIDKHSLMGACSKFFQYIVTGKTASVAKDVFTELGIADLGLGDDFDF
jgi:hypothetical protein